MTPKKKIKEIPIIPNIPETPERIVDPGYKEPFEPVIIPEESPAHNPEHPEISPPEDN